MIKFHIYWAFFGVSGIKQEYKDLKFRLNSEQIFDSQYFDFTSGNMWSNDHRPNSRRPHRRSGDADTSDISGTWKNYSTKMVLLCIKFLPVVNAVGGQSRTVAIGSPTNETCASSNSQLFLAVAFSQARVQGAGPIELCARPCALLVAFHPLQNWLEGGEGGSSGGGWSNPTRSTR